MKLKLNGDPMPKDDKTVSAINSLDYYNLSDLLSEQERDIQGRIRTFVNKKVAPVIDEYAQQETFPDFLVSELARQGLLGPTIPTKYGGGGQTNMVYGLMMQELERGDSSLRSFCSVQSALVMYPITRFGSNAQKEKWLPKLARGQAIGCFALTEPEHGSDPAALETRVREKGDGYVVTGHKRWSTNASKADVAVVWAKDEQEVIQGFLVELDREGVAVLPITKKWSLRAAITSEIKLQEVWIPKENRLPKAKGLKAPLNCLTQARYGIAWGVVGAALSCYETASRHALNRHQFGRPIGQFQLIQERLVDMLTEITKAQLLVYRLGQLKDQGKLRPQQVSLAKRNNCTMALEVARSARQVLGGDGILGKYPVMRHLMNLESVVTYEGTHEIHTLAVGRDITGRDAFSG